MKKYLREDGEFLSYLKDLVAEEGEIRLEKGIETIGSIFGSLGLDRLANVVGTAKSLAEPVGKLGYNLASNVLNYREIAKEKEQREQRDKRIKQRLEEQERLEEKDNSATPKGGGTTKAIRMKRKTNRRKQSRKPVKKTNNKQSHKLVKKKIKNL